MSTKPDLDVIARRIKAAQDDAEQLEPITKEFEGFDLADGYEVLHRIHEARLAEGSVPVGRKIGFTNSNIWQQYGVNAPIWGYVYDTTVVQALDQQVTCELGSFVEPKIEPEIVVHLARSPVDDSISSLLRCVDWIAHGFEVVQSHFPGWKFQAADTVADSALHGGLLIGEAVPIGELGDDPEAKLKAFSVTLFRDGRELETGTGSNVLGSPLAAVAHLIKTLAGQPRYAPLQAGEIVTTGTLTSAYPVQVGESYATKFEGVPLPGLSVEFEA